jgi:hypothetical protein
MWCREGAACAAAQTPNRPLMICGEGATLQTCRQLPVQYLCARFSPARCRPVKHSAAQHITAVTLTWED